MKNPLIQYALGEISVTAFGKLTIIFLVALTFVGVTLSCTDNQMARNYGGTETIELPKGEKLINATWKTNKTSADLWFLTEKMDSTYVPKTKYFREKSNYGVWEGTVVFVESK